MHFLAWQTSLIIEVHCESSPSMSCLESRSKGYLHPHHTRFSGRWMSMLTHCRASACPVDNFLCSLPVCTRFTRRIWTTLFSMSSLPLLAVHSFSLCHWMASVSRFGCMQTDTGGSCIAWAAASPQCNPCRLTSTGQVLVVVPLLRTVDCACVPVISSIVFYVIVHFPHWANHDDAAAASTSIHWAVHAHSTISFGRIVRQLQAALALFSLAGECVSIFWRVCSLSASLFGATHAQALRCAITVPASQSVSIWCTSAIGYAQSVSAVLNHCLDVSGWSFAFGECCAADP